MIRGAQLGRELEAWVSAHADRLVDEWREACRIPSVSADGPEAVAGMAKWLVHRASPIFDQLTILDSPGGAPILLGRLDGAGPWRLLIYTHYDVVPPGDGWSTDPFGGDLVDGKMFARGAGDDKADVVSRLQALEAWRALHGQLPFTVLWLSEGMEEVGSPGLRETIAAHRPAIEADACLWESYYRSVDGTAATVGFGSRGALSVELSVRMLESDTHSAMAGVYRSAASILTRALASLADTDGRVLIPGFYDGIAAFSERDAETVERTPLPPLQERAAELGALWSEDPNTIVRNWLYEPSLNLASIHAGPASGEHEATVLPARARARIDMRLMPGQDPAEIFAALERHLSANGFPEVAVRSLNAISPAASSLDSRLALVVRQASKELFGGAEPLLHPVVPGSGPLHLFTSAMELDAVMPPGTIRPDSGMHGPDENARVSHYLDEVRLTLRILELLASSEEAET